jgi:hypothetical protein
MARLRAWFLLRFSYTVVFATSRCGFSFAFYNTVVAVLMLQTSLIASITTPQIESVKGYIEEFGSFARIPEEISGWFTDLFQKLATSNSITGAIVAIFTSGITVYMIVRGTVERKKLATTSRKGN